MGMDRSPLPFAEIWNWCTRVLSFMGVAGSMVAQTFVFPSSAKAGHKRRWPTPRSVRNSYKRCQFAGGGLEVAAGYQFSYFFPVHFADVETKPNPAARADVGGQVVFHRIGRNENLVIAGESFAANGNDAVAVMVVEEIGKDFLADMEAGMVAL